MAPLQPLSEVKGLWFTVGRKFILETYGPETLDACVARLGGRHGAILEIPKMWTLIRRGAGQVTVAADETHALVRYSEFPYFDDVNYRLLTLGAVRSLMTLCSRGAGARQARVELAAHTHDSLAVDVAY